MFIAKFAARDVMHRADDRKSICSRRQVREIFAEVNAWQPGLGDAILAANTVGRQRLRIERLVLRRSPGLKYEHHGLRRCGASRAGGLSLHPQELRKSCAE